jgi:predicted Rossmann-fold nucleotide-binding protein
LLAREGVALVFGGGCVGLMSVVADAALGAGGEAIGVIPRMLVERENRRHLGATWFDDAAREGFIPSAFRGWWWPQTSLQR